MTLPRAAAGSVLALASVLISACTPAQAAPSTFGPVIGSALLCRSHLDNAYFRSWLATAFGPAYRQEGGAHWFRVDATLWGKPVQEVMVGDDSHPSLFVAAVVDSKPEALEEAIRAGAGLRHLPVDASPFPLRRSNPGSVIAYHHDKSKIYCLRHQPLPVAP